MPRKDGREALRSVDREAAPHTRSGADDLKGRHLRSYDLGVSGFIVKPVTFDSLIEIVRTLGKYWFEIVELPV